MAVQGSITVTPGTRIPPRPGTPGGLNWRRAETSMSTDPRRFVLNVHCRTLLSFIITRASVPSPLSIQSPWPANLERVPVR